MIRSMILFSLLITSFTAHAFQTSFSGTYYDRGDVNNDFRLIPRKLPATVVVDRSNNTYSFTINADGAICTVTAGDLQGLTRPYPLQPSTYVASFSIAQAHCISTQIESYKKVDLILDFASDNSGRIENIEVRLSKKVGARNYHRVLFKSN